MAEYVSGAMSPGWQSPHEAPRYPDEDGWVDTGMGQMRVERHEHDALPHGRPPLDTRGMSPKDAYRLSNQGSPMVLLSLSCAGPECPCSGIFYGRAESAPTGPLYCDAHRPEPDAE